VQDIGQSQLQARYLRLNCLELFLDPLQWLAKDSPAAIKAAAPGPWTWPVHRFGIGIALGAQPIGFYCTLCAAPPARRSLDVEHKAAPRQAAATPVKSLRSSLGSSKMNSSLY